jgi:primosomal protein N' (replication factor Y)
VPRLAEVAVPVPLAHPLTYEVPERLAAEVTPGARVLCELGRRKLFGVVLAVEERALPDGGMRIKPIEAVVDREPVVPLELLSFLRELAHYYFAPIGEVLRLALPAVEREQVRNLSQQGELGLGDRLAGVKQVGGRRVAWAKATDALEAPGTLRGQAAAVLALLRGSGEQPVARLEERFGNARAALKKLASLGLCEIEQREVTRDPYFADRVESDTPPSLNDAQGTAAAQLEGAVSPAPARPRSTCAPSPPARRGARAH